MNKGAPPLVVIAGPTASGKSALGVALAQRTNGVIVNADSAQVYADLSVLSARPQQQEMGGIEHRLYGTRDGANPCSAADWAAAAKAVIAEVHGRGQTPILVGGTGLYLRTLLEGIAPVPAVRPEVRAEVRGAAVSANHERLRRHDPEAAGRLHPNDTTRIARALEVALSTGRPLAWWQSRREGGLRDHVDLSGLILLPPTAWLYPRCDRRFAAMLNDGALEEVEALVERNLPPALPVMRAIGVPEIAAFLAGELAREETLAAGAQATRRYAKRQGTWFRHQRLIDTAPFTGVLDAEGMAHALDLLTARRMEPTC